MHSRDRNSGSAGPGNRPKQSRRSGMLSCSTCGKPFHIDETPTPPFCSERCQLIDMGRWLDEEISVPHEGGNADHQGRPGGEWDDSEEEDDQDEK